MKSYYYSRTEKEKDLLRHTADDAKSALDGVAREKVRIISNIFIYMFWNWCLRNWNNIINNILTLKI